MDALSLIFVKLVSTVLPAGLDLESYEVVIVAFSGGKDSLACLLWLLLCGVPRSRIELWHHDVDGREGSTLFDWPVTRAYCAAVARAFGLPIYFSWKEGGLEREMLKQNAPTAGYLFETPEGLRRAGGKSRKRGTRLMYPQKSAKLSVRWCSAYAKIMVMDAAIRAQGRFIGRRTLVVTGERAEESAARAEYEHFEPHRADLRKGRTVRRHIDHWRPVHGFTTAEVWALIQLAGLAVHPAYRLGWGRVSCASCIFGSPNQWASLRDLNPPQFSAHVTNEARFGKTIDRKRSLPMMAAAGVAYDMREEDRRAALSSTFDEPVFIDPAMWKLPAGAFGESCGPS